jgi:hypothetical protein
LLFLRYLCLFGLLKPELAKIHNPANRGFSIGSNFYQVQPVFLGQFKSLFNLHDSGLLTIRADHANLWCSYVSIAPCLLLCCCDVSILLLVFSSSPPTHIFGEVLYKIFHRHAAKVFTRPGSDSNRAILNLPVADHKQIRNLA